MEFADFIDSRCHGLVQIAVYLRKDIRWANSPESAAVSLVHHELHMAELEHGIWKAYGTATPAHVLAHEGVGDADQSSLRTRFCR